MKNVISMKEYLHNREHAPMGCGPMESCHVCKAMGEENSNVTTSSNFLSTKEIAKYLILATIGTVFLELVVKPAIQKRKDGR